MTDDGSSSRLAHPSVLVRFKRARRAQAALLADFGRRLFHEAFSPMMEPPEDLAAYLDTAFALPKIEAELGEEGSSFHLGYCTVQAELPEELSRYTREPFGYCRVIVDSAHEHVAAERPLELVRIYVEQDGIGFGLGRAVFEHTLKLAQEAECDWIWLSSWQENDRANRFYERQGFRKVGTATFQLGAQTQHDFILARPV